MTTLVTVSGPGREALVERCLSSVFLRPGGALCTRGVVGWDGERVPRMLSGKWSPHGVEFVPGYKQRDIFKLLDEARYDEGSTEFTLWLRDDEHVTDDVRLHDMAADVLGSGWAPIEAPITAPGGPSSYAVATYNAGAFVSEPRLVHRMWITPAWMRPTLRALKPGYGPIVVGLIVRVSPRAGGIDSHRGLRLNIGAGPRAFSDWVTIDRDSAFVGNPLNVGKEPLPYPDESVEAIYCSHMLDHLDLREGRFFLAECRRVIKPGGRIRLSVCDLAVFIRRYNEGTIGELAEGQEAFDEVEAPGLKFGIVACGALADRDWYVGHRQLYDAEGLIEVMLRAGFAAEVRGEDERSAIFDDTDDIFPDHTLYVEATPCEPVPLPAPLPQPLNVVKVHDSPGGFKIVQIQGTFADHAALWTFFDEADVKARWWTPKKGETVFDVGAAYGSYTLPALVNGARVVAFSPSPPDTKILRANLAVNPELAKNAQVAEIGLYSESGYFDPDNCVFAKEPAGEFQWLRVMALDEMIGDDSDPIHWIKIDVEGAELEVLKGARATIVKHQPKVLVECHLFVDPELLAKCVAFMEGLDVGYEHEEPILGGSVLAHVCFKV
jgi:FkbM family methyltransferase